MDQQAKNILKFIYEAESNLNYNEWAKGFAASPDKPLTKMTVLEVLEWQQYSRNNGGNSAAGAGQIIYPTLRGLVNDGVLSVDDIFNEKTQNKANYSLMENQYSDWKSGRISDEKFGNKLAGIWASLPVLEQTKNKGKIINVGESFYKGVSGNKALVTPSEFKTALFSTTLDSSRKINFLSDNGNRVVGSDVPIIGGKMPPTGYYKEQYETKMPLGNYPMPQNEQGSLDLSLDQTGNLAQFERREELPSSYYKRTRVDTASNPRLHPGRWQAFTDEWTDAFLVRGIKSEIASSRYEVDPNFYPVNQAIADGYGNKHIHYLSHANNAEHYAYLKKQILDEQMRIQRREISNYHVTAFMGAMLSPDSIITFGIPIGFGASVMRSVGSNFLRSSLKSATAIGSAESALEAGRLKYDPEANGHQALLRVGLSTAFSGILGGAVGSYAGKSGRTALVNKVAVEIAQQKGIGKVSTKIDVNGKVVPIKITDSKLLDPIVFSSLKKRGVAFHKGEMLVDDAVLHSRYAVSDKKSLFSNAQEFFEYEIKKAAALVKNGGQKIIDKAEKVVPVQPAKTPDVETIPMRGEVQAGWRKATNTLSDAEMDRLSKLVDEAEVEAAAALTKYRRENNKILADAKMEAFGRILDSPFKYVHRNAKAHETRDLMNLLIDDGGLMQGAYRTGNVEMSVDRMKKAWDGRVNTLLEHETRLYEQYLGFSSNPEIGGIAINKSFRNRRADGSRAMSVNEFRDAVSKSVITGQSHEIAQVNQMANQLKSFYDEFRMPAEEYGVLQRGRAIEAGRANMQMQVRELKKQLDKGEVTNLEEIAEVEEMIVKLQKDIEDLTDRINISKGDPSEDYFTRVYMVNAIQQNRKAFKERVVKPWMEQQPYGYIWKDGYWKFTKFKTTPKAIDKRAEDIIETILQEGEILDLAAHRASQRPSFGRTRQFDLPNSFLLKDGPNGNGIADFIDTNYATNAKLYTDRMAPAIEMSRAFARPADGVDWVKGFNEALDDVRAAEMKEFLQKRNFKDISKQKLDDIDFQSGDKIKAYHGTRQSFDNFDESFIGTGQGAAWQGRGFYFSRQLRDAADYANQAWQKKNKKGSLSGAKGSASEEIIYEIELPSGSQLLNTRGSLKEQAPDIQKKIKQLLEKYPNLKNLRENNPGFVQRLQSALKQELGKDADINGVFKSFGIKGHTTKTGKEIVIYSADDIKIIKKPDEFLVQKSSFEDHWNPIEEKIRHVADRVTNRVFKDPNRWDNRTAMVLKDWSHLTFMGLSALSAIPEIGTIIMQHGMGRVFRAQFHDLDSAMAQVRKSAIAEGAKAGAMMDINMGAALASFSETGVEAALTSKPEMWLKTAANKYFLLNGLATVTTKLKQLDLTIRVPDMLDKIIKVGDDVATTDEIAELARYGISKFDAQRMAKEPIEELDGMFLANTDNWGSQELAHKFRAAIKSGNENTIIAATAADKPIIADGVVYLKSNPVVDEFAEKLGAEKRGSSWKFQSGLLALPFTFWNYAIGATNKILLAGLDEVTSQKMAGIAAIVGLGYMVAAVKTPSERWDSMDLDDRIRVAIENSGIVGVLSNYTNLTQGSVIGLTGQNPFPWSPEHNYYPSAMDALFNIAGAGPSVARNLVEGVTTGDPTMTSWAMPLRNHIFLKWLFDAAIDNLEGDKLQGVA